MIVIKAVVVQQLPSMAISYPWEAYDAKTVRMIEETAPGYLYDHTAVRKMITEGKFTDGTEVLLTA